MMAERKKTASDCIDRPNFSASLKKSRRFCPKRVAASTGAGPWPPWNGLRPGSSCDVSTGWPAMPAAWPQDEVYPCHRDLARGAAEQSPDRRAASPTPSTTRAIGNSPSTSAETRYAKAPSSRRCTRFGGNTLYDDVFLVAGRIVDRTGTSPAICSSRADGSCFLKINLVAP